MQRDPDGLHLLAVDVERLQAARHHRYRANKAALAADFHPVAVGNPFRFCQPFANFDKLFRLRDGIEQRMLGPGMEMLGQTIGGPDIRELILLT